MTQRRWRQRRETVGVDRLRVSAYQSSGLCSPAHLRSKSLSTHTSRPKPDRFKRVRPDPTRDCQLESKYSPGPTTPV